jgi:hypothetical protein
MSTLIAVAYMAGTPAAGAVPGSAAAVRQDARELISLSFDEDGT